MDQLYLVYNNKHPISAGFRVWKAGFPSDCKSRKRRSNALQEFEKREAVSWKDTQVDNCVGIGYNRWSSFQYSY